MKTGRIAYVRSFDGRERRRRCARISFFSFFSKEGEAFLHVDQERKRDVRDHVLERDRYVVSMFVTSRARERERAKIMSSSLRFYSSRDVDSFRTWNEMVYIDCFHVFRPVSNERKRTHGNHASHVHLLVSRSFHSHLLRFVRTFLVKEESNARESSLEERTCKSAKATFRTTEEGTFESFVSECCWSSSKRRTIPKNARNLSFFFVERICSVFVLA